jgi:hypothetical protein
MKEWAGIIKNFLRTFWWVVVLILAAVLFVIGGFLFSKRKTDGGKESSESFVTVVASRVSDAFTDVKVDRAVIFTKSEAKRQELEEIRKEPDGKKRRERLAAVLRKSF